MMYFKNKTDWRLLLLSVVLIWGGCATPVLAQQSNTDDQGPSLGSPDSTLGSGERGMCGGISHESSRVLTTLVPESQVIETTQQTPVIYVLMPRNKNVQFVVDVADFGAQVSNPHIFESVPLSPNRSSDVLLRLLLPPEFQLTETSPENRYRYLWTVNVLCTATQDEEGGQTVGGYWYPLDSHSTTEQSSWLMQLEAAFAARETNPEQWAHWLTENGYGDWIGLPVQTIELEAVTPPATTSEAPPAPAVAPPDGIGASPRTHGDVER